MWKVIQGDEKAEFIKDYRDKKYEFGNIAAVDLSGSLGVSWISNISVDKFAMDDIVILVKVD